MQIVEKLKRTLRNRFSQTDGFRYTVRELVGMCENSRIAQAWHGQALSDEILRYKKSDTVFLLGSGPSINDITPETWEHIRRHDSIGFNHWFVHDFVPTFYVYQHKSYIFRALKPRFHLYSGVPLIMRGSNFASGEVDFANGGFDLFKQNPVFYLNEYPISSQCSIDIDLLYRYFECLGYMTRGHIAPFIPKLRSTIGLLSMLAYQMGYSKIVLCGVDMDSDHHFWDHPSYARLKQELSLPLSAPIHKFTDTSISKNTVPAYLYHLNSWMKQKGGAEITVLSPKTVLYPTIPLYQA